MPIFRLRKNEISFPNPKLAEENGLLAFGGDLCVERLLLAYMNGIFPWYHPGEEKIFDRSGRSPHFPFYEKIYEKA